MNRNGMAALINHIEAYLKKEGKPMRQLAQAADVPVPTLSRFLNGKRGLSAQNIRKLAVAAGESSDDWLLKAGIREQGAVTVASGLTKSDIERDFPTREKHDLELSDKIARLTPANRAIVESVVDLMLAQNTSTSKRR